MKGPKPSLHNVIPMKGDMAAPVPTAPDWMTSEAREAWDRLAPSLVAKSRLEPAFEDSFAAYCECVADVIRLTGDLAIMGSYYEVKTRNGMQQKHRAAWTQRGQAISLMNQLSARFGLTPVDDARLKSGGQGDLFADLLEQINGSR